MPTMKNVIIAIIGFVLLLAAMHLEYRIIMHNVKPYKGENNTVYLEIFGQVDEYYADDVSEMER